MNKTVLTSFTVLCLLSTVFLMGVALNIQTVKASATVYIRADGSVDPLTAPISSVDNVTYTFTANIYDSIVVERDNIIVDGAGYTVKGTGSGIGIDLTDRSNVTIKNTEIRAFDQGIWLSPSSNNKVLGNKIADNAFGVWVFASNNTISGNTITNNSHSGVVIDVNSSNNTISGNNITNNNRGVWLILASDNKFYHNNFIDNTQQVYAVTTGYANFWDDGYPSGGNYWSDYTGVDSDQDAIGDTPHVIDADNKDNYPLMGMFSVFEATKQHYVNTISNSTISNFVFGEDYNGLNNTISFNVTGANGTIGFCRIMIPRGLMEGPYALLINEEVTSVTELPISNSTHVFLYFTYVHSTHTVIIFSWEDLLDRFIELLADYQSLNATYIELLDAHDELLADYTELNSTYHALLLNYTELLGNYDSLQTNFTSLQSDYNSLNSALNDLQEDYDALNALYNNLNATYNDLKSEQEATFSKLNNMRDLMYAFIATTILFIVTTVYFATRKPKTRPKRKAKEKS